MRVVPTSARYHSDDVGNYYDDVPRSAEYYGVDDFFGKPEGFYDEFAQTGGFSDQDRGLFRARAASAFPSLADVLKRQDSRFNSGANSARIGKDFGRLLGESRLGTETELANQIRQGRQFGAAGLERIGGARTARDTATADRFTDANKFNLAHQAGLANAQTSRDLSKADLDTRTNIANLSHRLNLADAQTGRDFGLADREYNILRDNRDARITGGALGSDLYRSPHGPTGLHAGRQQGLIDSELGRFSLLLGGADALKAKEGGGFWANLGSILGGVGGAASGIKK